MAMKSVVGIQWGDEGKGKITDYLAQQMDVVVRYQGGNNAGHTIKFDDKSFALHLIPSGVFNPSVKNYMTNGMVINIQALAKELNMLREGGISCKNLFISDRAHVILPYHISLDEAFEDAKSPSQKIGTTKNGIGPAYSDKAARDGIRVGDLLDKERLLSLLEQNLATKNVILKAFGKPTFIAQDLYDELEPHIEMIRPLITDTSLELTKDLDAGKNVLTEGAQGVMLCLDHGSYPFVTSSSPTASSIPVNAGIAPHYVTSVLGVVKAYTTRVGAGFFATEMGSDEEVIADEIRRIGNEFGTTTGRPRRIGWLDTVVLNHAKRVSGVTELTITLLDVLDERETLKICDYYVLDGKRIDYLPSSISTLERCKPHYIEIPGWTSGISETTQYENLPTETKHYLQTIEDLTGLPVKIVSVGPKRSQTIKK